MGENNANALSLMAKRTIRNRKEIETRKKRKGRKERGGD
jgi:hypothetical protein